jgi:hypothetical protein
VTFAGRHEIRDPGSFRMDDVVRITDLHLLNTLARFPADILQNDSKRAFWLSLAVAKHFFGNDWLEQHVSVENPEPGFLRVIAGDDDRTQISTFRIVDLAELLFNLQNVSGFDCCIDRMREGNIESTYAELEFGRMLYSAGAVFRFVEPQQKKGADYDIEIILDDGTTVCADAKCKVETTEFSFKTVLNTLEHARKQFPKGRPSAIFAKVPFRWVETSEIGIELNQVANRFLRGTQRVVSIKYYISDVAYRDGMLTHRHVFNEVSNPNNKFDPNRNWDMFAEPNPTSNWNGMPLRWKRLLFFPKDGPDSEGAR